MMQTGGSAKQTITKQVSKLEGAKRPKNRIWFDSGLNLANSVESTQSNSVTDSVGLSLLTRWLRRLSDLDLTLNLTKAKNLDKSGAASKVATTTLILKLSLDVAESSSQNQNQTKLKPKPKRKKGGGAKTNGGG